MTPSRGLHFFSVAGKVEYLLRLHTHAPSLAIDEMRSEYCPGDLPSEMSMDVCDVRGRNTTCQPCELPL